MTPPRKKPGQRNEAKVTVTLKTIAEQLGLTPGTVSAALNNSLQLAPSLNTQRIASLQLRRP
jgi:DNA-binding CsgD family transcriptional regulator